MDPVDMSASYGPGAPGKIHSFLRAAAAEVVSGITPSRFMELRYDQMNQWYPHAAFSTQEATLSFFAVTLAYVTGERSIPATEPDDRPYRANYLDWCRLHAKMHEQK